VAEVYDGSIKYINSYVRHELALYGLYVKEDTAMNIYHHHHIIPKHMGGSDDPSNIICLTIEEHAEAHKKLWEEYGKQEDYLAWMGLFGHIGKEEIIKTKQSIGGKKGGISLTGIKKSEEHKNKMSIAKIGKSRDEQTKQKIKINNLNKKRSNETKQNIRNSRLGTEHSEETKLKIAESMKKMHEKRKLMNGYC